MQLLQRIMMHGAHSGRRGRRKGRGPTSGYEAYPDYSGMDEDDSDDVDDVDVLARLPDHLDGPMEGGSNGYGLDDDGGADYEQDPAELQVSIADCTVWMTMVMA